MQMAKSECGKSCTLKCMLPPSINPLLAFLILHDSLYAFSPLLTLLKRGSPARLSVGFATHMYARSISLLLWTLYSTSPLAEGADRALRGACVVCINACVV